MNFEKPKKSEFWRKCKKKCWRYYHFTRVYQKPQSYEVMRYSSWDTGWNRIFLSFWAIFCPFTPPTRNNQENQNFEKMKEASGDVIILNLCTKSTIIWCVLMYRKFFVIFVIFALLPHYSTRKLKFLKNEKNTWRYHNFIQVYHKWQSNDVSFMRYEVQQNF